MNGFSVLVLSFCLAAHGGQDNSAWKRHTIDSGDDQTGKRGADGVRLADVNGDGWLDIATGWEEGGAVAVYINPGPDQSTEPWPSVTIGTVPGVEDAVFADLDSDGAVDVVTCAEGNQNRVYVHWAPKQKQDYLTGTAWRQHSFPATEGRRWMFALPLDMNDDGHLDLVIGSKNQDAMVGWLENPGHARDVQEWKLHHLAAAGWIMSLRAHDINGDSSLDIVYSDRRGNDSGVYWLERPKTRSQNWVRERIGGERHEVMFLTVGNLRDRQSTSVVCSTLEGEVLHFRRNEMGEWLEDPIPLPFGLKAGKGVAIADINLDGQADLVTTSESQREKEEMIAVAWKEQQGTEWIDHAISGSSDASSDFAKSGRKFDRVEVLDLDGDGDLDVLTCEEHDNLGVFWYENPTR